MCGKASFVCEVVSVSRIPPECRTGVEFLKVVKQEGAGNMVWDILLVWVTVTGADIVEYD